MSVKEETVLLQQIKLRLKKLSPDRLRVADDFLAYLEEREESEATQELLAIPGFNAALQAAKRQAKSGEVVRLKDIRRNVCRTLAWGCQPTDR